MLFEEIKFKGHVKATVNKGTEKEKVIYDDHNSIATAIRAMINSGFSANQEYRLADLFTAVANPPAAGKDGIIIMDDGGTATSMVTTKSASTYSTTFTGILTGVSLTSETAYLGVNIATAISFSTLIASASVAYTLTSADTLTIEWTISI